jgi:hypothetical protein
MSKTKKLLSILLFSCWSFLGCESDVANVVGVSASSFIIAVEAVHGPLGLPADGSSQALIRVELFTNAGQLVNAQDIVLTTTLGTLAGATLTGDGEADPVVPPTTSTNGGALTIQTINGFAFATLTSEAVEGNAFVIASVENISATVAVPFVNITTAAN